MAVLGFPVRATLPGQMRTNVCLLAEDTRLLIIFSLNVIGCNFWEEVTGMINGTWILDQLLLLPSFGRL